MDNAIKSRITRYLIATGVAPDTAKAQARAYSGHSGRVGFVVAATEAGATEIAIASTTRHTGLDMIRRYGKPASKKKLASHKLKGVGV